ncbi:MAG: HDOD domain-containing protein [Deltaproteobacteria bacterium]
MIAILLVLTTGVVLGLLYFVLKQNKKTRQGHEKDMKSALLHPGAAKDKKSAAELPFAADPGSAAHTSDHEPDFPDAYASLRQFLKKGIDEIFNNGAGAREDSRKPLARREIEPRILDEAVKSIAGLNDFRSEHFRLQKMINDPSVQMTDLTRIILSDPVMTAKILRMANSSYFGVTQKIDSISHALMLLGLQNIKNILYREGLRQLFQTKSATHREAVAALWKHSTLVSICAQHLHDLFGGLNRGTLFTLGIVHDIGKLMILELPQAKGRETDFWGKYPGGILVGEEDQILGVNHAVIGGLALEHWNFSELMTEVVSAHHLPSYIDAGQTGLTDEKIKYVTVLFLADQLAGLFADWSEGIVRAYPLRESYSALLDKNKLINQIQDANFLAQIREAERLAMDEK